MSFKKYQKQKKSNSTEEDIEGGVCECVDILGNMRKAYSEDGYKDGDLCCLKYQEKVAFIGKGKLTGQDIISFIEANPELKKYLVSLIKSAIMEPQLNDMIK